MERVIYAHVSRRWCVLSWSNECTRLVGHCDRPQAPRHGNVACAGTPTTHSVAGAAIADAAATGTECATGITATVALPTADTVATCWRHIRAAHARWFHVLHHLPGRRGWATRLRRRGRCPG